MDWSALPPSLIGALIGAAAAIAGQALQARYHRRQYAAAAEREAAWRTQDRVQCHLEHCLRCARRVTRGAAARRTEDLEDFSALEHGIDVLEASLLTEAIAEAANDMRHAALQAKAAIGTMNKLNENQQGTAAARYGDNLDQRCDQAAAAAAKVRSEVKLVLAELDRRQRTSA